MIEDKMTLQRRLQRLILDLEEIKDEARYTDEKEQLQEAIDKLSSINVYSDQFD